VNGEAQTEDLTILAALEALERGPDAPPGTPRADRAAGPADDTAEMLARLYTEALGLVPFELAPVAPTAGGKARLLAAIGAAAPAVQPSPAAVTPAEPVRAPAPPLPVPQRGVPPRAAARSSRPGRWPLALAATLALALLGLSLWLYSQIGAQRATIAGLRHQLALERARSEGAIAKVRQLENDSLDLHQKFALVTSRAVTVSPMRPAGQPGGQPPLQPEAHGMLFVAADHQHWYMALQDLQPAPAGTAYKLWFLAERGPVSSGAFTGRPGDPMDLSSKNMPAGTKGAIVTLESDPNAAAPTGPTILQAAPPYQIS